MIYFVAKASPAVRRPHLTVRVYPKKTKVMDHGIASIYCETSPNPIPRMYWRRNGRRITIEGHYEFYRIWGGSVLRINTVKHRRDNARFDCVVYDDKHPTVYDSGHLIVYRQQSSK